MLLRVEPVANLPPPVRASLLNKSLAALEQGPPSSCLLLDSNASTLFFT